jgi:hypothetical protein
MPEDGVERHPAPIHLILTHERPSIRSIQLSVLPSALDSHDQSETAAIKCEPENLRNEIADNEMTTFNTAPSSPILSPSSLPIVRPKAPRLVFSVRLKETIKASDLSRDLFVDWLRDVPAAVAWIEIEAGFNSYSTLLIVSMPMTLASYIPKNPAIVCLGPITSSNQVFERRQRSSALPVLNPSRLQNNSHATQQLHVSHVGEYTDRILPSASAVTETFLRMSPTQENGSQSRILHTLSQNRLHIIHKDLQFQSRQQHRCLERSTSNLISPKGAVDTCYPSQCRPYNPKHVFAPTTVVAQIKG